MLNLVYLAAIAFMPFPTALVGKYENFSDHRHPLRAHARRRQPPRSGDVRPRPSTSVCSGSELPARRLPLRHDRLARCRSSRSSSRSRSRSRARRSRCLSWMLVWPAEWIVDKSSNRPSRRTPALTIRRSLRAGIPGSRTLAPGEQLAPLVAAGRDRSPGCATRRSASVVVGGGEGGDDGCGDGEACPRWTASWCAAAHCAASSGPPARRMRSAPISGWRR